MAPTDCSPSKLIWPCSSGTPRSCGNDAALFSVGLCRYSVGEVPIGLSALNQSWFEFCLSLWFGALRSGTGFRQKVESIQADGILSNHR